VNARAALIALCVVAGLVALDRFLLWCEVRGWIYYRRTKRRPGLGTSPLLDLLAVYHPSQRHVIEQRVRAADEQDGEEKDGGRPEATDDAVTDDKGARP
jgi:hypothetical protein